MGADTSSLGEAGLTYTWSVMRAPRDAKAVSFVTDGNSAAKSTTARVQKAVTYVLNCTITNVLGNSVSTQVVMTIRQVASDLRLSAHAAQLNVGSVTQIAGIALDQFKHSMQTAGTVVHKLLAGSGSIAADGEFTAGEQKGHVIVQETVEDLTGQVGATIK